MYNRRKEAETLFSEKKRKKKVKGIVRSGIAPCWGVFDYVGPSLLSTLKH